jgi:hypothetical protein
MRVATRSRWLANTLSTLLLSEVGQQFKVPPPMLPKQTTYGRRLGLPHELNDTCTKNNLPCDPGMKGCVLAGRYVFANEDKNTRLHQRQAREQGTTPPQSTKNPLDDTLE